jgi:hypothetical protein
MWAALMSSAPPSAATGSRLTAIPSARRQFARRRLAGGIAIQRRPQQRHGGPETANTSVSSCDLKTFFAANCNQVLQ